MLFSRKCLNPPPPLHPENFLKTHRGNHPGIHGGVWACTPGRFPWRILELFTLQISCNPRWPFNSGFMHEYRIIFDIGDRSSKKFEKILGLESPIYSKKTGMTAQNLSKFSQNGKLNNLRQFFGEKRRRTIKINQKTKAKCWKRQKSQFLLTHLSPEMVSVIFCHHLFSRPLGQI